MSDTAQHLATFEAAGPAAVRAHLDAEHAIAVRDQLGMPPLDVPFPAEVHRYLHGLIHAPLASPKEPEA